MQCVINRLAINSGESYLLPHASGSSDSPVVRRTRAADRMGQCEEPSVRVLQRAQIVAMAADGVTSQDIAEQLAISRPTVQRWRERFLALRVTGLEQDAPRPGRISSLPATKIRGLVAATLHTKPPAATHWSTRTMAHAHGASEATVRRIWKQHNLQPHVVKTFTLSRDKQFLATLTDVVGLYLNPVDNYGPHKHGRVKSWIRRHPRFQLHFIPTSSSW